MKFIELKKTKQLDWLGRKEVFWTLAIGPWCIDFGYCDQYIEGYEAGKEKSDTEK